MVGDLKMWSFVPFFQFVTYSLFSEKNVEMNCYYLS